jgi:hypothetical protein
VGFARHVLGNFEFGGSQYLNNMSVLEKIRDISVLCFFSMFVSVYWACQINIWLGAGAVYFSPFFDGLIFLGVAFGLLCLFTFGEDLIKKVIGCCPPVMQGIVGRLFLVLLASISVFSFVGWSLLLRFFDANAQWIFWPALIAVTVVLFLTGTFTSVFLAPVDLRFDEPGENMFNMPDVNQWLNNLKLTCACCPCGFCKTGNPSPILKEEDEEAMQAPVDPTAPVKLEEGAI